MNKKLLCCALVGALGFAQAVAAQEYDDRWYVSGDLGVALFDGERGLQDSAIYKIGVGKFPYAASGRAIGQGRTEGFTKLLFDEATHKVIGAGIVPAGLEMMDRPATRAAEEFVRAGYDLTAEAILLCESDGTPDEVEEEVGRMAEVLRRSGATAITVSFDEAQRLRFWSGRKNAFPASGRISPDYMCMDSTIPRKRLADILLAI